MSATPLSKNIKGWWNDIREGRLSAYFNATAFLHGNATGVTIPGTLTTTGAQTVTGGQTLSGANRFHATAASFFGFGAGEAVTIASGVATVTKPYVILDAEGAGTTDQLDTITYTGAQDGDLLLLAVNATDTITVDDANINLAAATRAIAPGGTLLLRFDGTEWTEVLFTAATDNT